MSSEAKNPRIEAVQGGCLCEAIRYTITFPPDHDFSKSVSIVAHPLILNQTDANPGHNLPMRAMPQKHRLSPRPLPRRPHNLALLLFPLLLPSSLIPSNSEALLRNTRHRARLLQRLRQLPLLGAREHTAHVYGRGHAGQEAPGGRRGGSHAARDGGEELLVRGGGAWGDGSSARGAVEVR